MDNNIRIIGLPENRWKEYRALRLLAIKDSPEAFMDTEEETLAFPEEKWRQRLSSPSGFMLFAEADEMLVGTISAFWEGGKRCRHVGHVVGFFVRKEYRGRGIGKQLFTAVLEKFKQYSHIEKICLGVVETQEAAHNLYKKFGFQEIGRKEKEQKVGDNYYDEHLMELLLHRH